MCDGAVCLMANGQTIVVREQTRTIRVSIFVRRVSVFTVRSPSTFIVSSLKHKAHGSGRLTLGAFVRNIGMVWVNDVII